MKSRHVVLVIGVPRSGSTWLTDILSSREGTDLVMEPDNEKTSLLASVLKTNVPRFPVLAAGEPGPPALELLWDTAFRGNLAPVLSRSRLASVICRARHASGEAAIAGKAVELDDAGRSAAPALFARALCGAPGGRYRPRRIVKSVHAVLCPEWIAERCRPACTLIIMRHPLAVLQSWRRMQMPDAFRLTPGEAPGSFQSPEVFARMAEQLCRMFRALNAAAARNPEWSVIWHEDLCTDPIEQLRAVAEQSGIGWDDGMEQRVAQMDQAGRGYKPQRKAVDEIDKWRRDVSREEIAVARDIFERGGVPGLIEE